MNSLSRSSRLEAVAKINVLHKEETLGTMILASHSLDPLDEIGQLRQLCFY
jgi:hypothetical protein